MKTWKILIGIVPLASALTMSTVAYAHHSFAMFDHNKFVIVEGTLKKFDYASPHSWIWVVDKEGKTWGFETEGPISLNRWGFRKSLIQVGDRIWVTAHPTRDGTNNGSMMSVQTTAGMLYSVGQLPRPATDADKIHPVEPKY